MLALWKPLGERHHSPLLFFSPFFALIFLCNLPASQARVRRYGAYLLVPIWLVWTFNFRMHANPAVEDPTGGAMNFADLYFCMALVTLDRLVWSNLESFQRFTGKSKEDKPVLEPVPAPFTWERCTWALSLVLSFRGAGWNWEVKHTPPPTGRTKAGLLIETLISMPIRILGSDILYTWLLLYLPSPLASTSVWSLPWHKQLVLTTASIFHQVFNNPFLLNCLNLPSLLFSNIPADHYRPYWGQASSIQSLGTAWGVAWHQGLRRITSRPAYICLQKTNVRRGTFLYFALHIMIAFTLSGLAHQWTILCSGSWGWRTLAFFLLQGAGIVFEAALHVLSPWTCPRWIKTVWAIAFVAAISPLFLEDLWSYGAWSQPNPEANLLLPLCGLFKGRVVGLPELLQDLRQVFGSSLTRPLTQ